MIGATVVLVGHSLGRIRGVLVGLGLLLAGFQFLLTQVAGYLLRTSAFGQLSMIVPDFVRTIAGPSIAGVVSFGYVAVGDSTNDAMRQLRRRVQRVRTS